MLGQDHVVATGGGPGAMEAANLGGRLAGSSRDHLAAAVATLSAVPSYHPSVDAWAHKAFDVLTGVVGAGVAGDPDVVLRPRAAQRVRDRDREVLPQRDA